jgi:hypothetical protein
VHRAITHIRARMQSARDNRATASASVTHVGPIPIRFPWEKEAEKTLNKIEGAVSGILNMDCNKTAEHFAYAGGAAAGAGVLLQGGGPLSEAVGGMLINLGARAGIAAGIFYGASKVGVC